jgi:cellulose synthase/poly-beta-1,6-N-acetylglucosamine synthase-like glycosyltransferase
LFFNYLGYALITYLFLLFRKRKDNVSALENEYRPGVSFIVAAYNEADCIEMKIRNSLEQDYPPHLLEFIFITDGSTDDTNSIIQRFPEIKLLYTPERSGKSAALNRAVLFAKNEILIFSDANAFLNNAATKNIVRHYFDPKTGGVAGEKKVIQNSGAPNDKVNSEGAYWKYESMLKKIDSDFYSVVGAAGELFSVRKNLYTPPDNSVILDDFIISMKVAQRGYKIVYEPNAHAAELPSFSLRDEQKRKIRISAGGYQAIWMLRSLFRFWENPRLFFLYFSHRFLRWTLSPLCLITAFVSNLILFLNLDSWLYTTLFVLQVLFYAFAVLGSFTEFRVSKFKIFRLCYYFVFMNISVVAGFFRFLNGRQPATWEKAKRTQAS